MKKTGLSFLIFLFTFPICWAQQAVLSPRIANYDIQVELDTEAKKLIGQSNILWKNTSPDTIYTLQFHLYWNAFKNTESTFFSQAEDFSFLMDGIIENCTWSWVDVNGLKDNAGNDLTTSMQYIQPDDDNLSDETVLEVSLPNPILPSKNIELELAWESKIPKTMVRTGYNKDYYFMAQWFPKLGVYEAAGDRYATAGKWNCHQYHSNGEYYSDFGNYKVAITAPKDFVVGSSGVLQDLKTGEKNNTHTYVVNDVIDFTWTASPHFVEKKTNYKNTELRLLTYPEHAHFADRYFTAIKNAMEYMEQHFMTYPYPSLTIVDPPFHGIFSAGMEYPTLITAGSFCFLPIGVKTTETLAVHEFIHQYFMQIVATNEQEEPWLDEGFTTYYEGRILDHYYGERTSMIDHWGIKVGNSENNRIGYLGMNNPSIASNDNFSREFSSSSYGSISYNKTGLWLRTLEGIVGRETMDELMRRYFDQWKFKHPCGKDFIAVANAVIQERHGDQFGENMNWYFDQVVYDTKMCDYQLASISNVEQRGQSGYLENTDDCIQAENFADKKYKSSIDIYRLGEMQLPITVDIHFENGETITESWSGMERQKTFTFYSDTKIDCAEIDPERNIYIDKNFINNSLTTEPQKKGVRKYLGKFMTWMQNAMMSVAGLV